MDITRKKFKHGLIDLTNELGIKKEGLTHQIQIEENMPSILNLILLHLFIKNKTMLNVFHQEAYFDLLKYAREYEQFGKVEFLEQE